jgi:hypothetical protein
MQEKFGDVLAQHRTESIWIEVKAEEKYTGNFFIEEWSNYSKGNPGWMHKLDTDMLWYHFLDVERVYLIDFQELKRWLFSPPEWCRYETRAINIKQYPFVTPPEWSEYLSGQVNMNEYPLIDQQKTTQMNDTWGRLVPVMDIMQTKSIKSSIRFLGQS